MDKNRIVEKESPTCYLRWLAESIQTPCHGRLGFMMHNPREKCRFAPVVWALLSTLQLAIAQTAIAEQADPTADEPTTIAEKMAQHQKHEGLLTFYTDTTDGKVWLQLPAAQGPRGTIGQFLYIEGLRQGLGSNPVGLDRGQLGPSRVVNFRRVGGRVIVEQVNLRYRALSDNADERDAVRQSFATSILWAADIEIEDPDKR